MKIGILTFHSVTNYGAALQCLGLQRLLKKLHPQALVEVINYQPPVARNYYLHRHLIKNKEYSYIFKMLAFWMFRKKHFRLSGGAIGNREALKRLSQRYDMVFVGSDEVWKISAMRGWDPTYFLDFVDEKTTRLISYAASSSEKTDYQPYSTELERFFQRFSHVSVRDSYTRQNVEAVSGVQATEVLDPTLLANFDDLLTDAPGYAKPYILVYAKLNGHEMRIVSAQAKKLGCKIVSIGHKNKLSDKAFMFAAPHQFLHLIKNAELVITNYFHGILFSLKYKTPFIPLVHPSKRGKVTDVAAKLGFSDKLRLSLVDEGKPKDLFDLCVHSKSIQPGLAEWQEKSLEFLNIATETRELAAHVS